MNETHRDELDINEISQLLGGVEPERELSIDDILSEYKSGGVGEPALYSPGTDRELERSIEGVVNTVMTEDQERRLSRRKLEDSIRRANKKEEKQETLTRLKQEKAKKKREEKKAEYARPPVQDEKPQKDESAGRRPKAARTNAEGKKGRKVIYLETPPGGKTAEPPAKRPRKRKALKALPKPEKKEEPALGDAEKHVRRGVGSLRRRGIASLLLCVLLLYMSMAQEFGLPQPNYGDGGNAALIFFALNLLVLALCIERVIIGLRDLLTLKFSALTVLAIANILCLLDAFILFLNKNAGGLTPACAVCALGLSLSLFSERMSREGLSTGFKMAASVADPYVLTREDGICAGKPAVIKSEAGVKGFVSAALEPDAYQKFMRAFAPIILLACILLAALACFAGSATSGFLHTLSVIMAMAVPVGSLLSFSSPFRAVQKKLRRGSCALAGYQGARAIAGEKRVIITDRDVFPLGTVSLNGIKLMDGYSSGKVASAVLALLKAAGSNLEAAFAEMQTEGYHLRHEPDSFELLEGGYGGLIEGERVVCGEAGLMRRMGIRLPAGVNVKNAVFVAFGQRLAGVFALNYYVSPASATALTALIDSGAVPVLVSDDFNVTAAMVTERFNLRSGEVVEPDGLLEIDGIYGSALAVLCREGFSCMAGAVAGARKLTRSVRANIRFSLLASILGVAIAALILFLGADHILTAGKLSLFSLVWLVPLWLNSASASSF